MIRTALQVAVGAILVLGAFWNLLFVDANIAGLQPRSEEDITILEGQYLPVEFAMIKELPAPKRIGYMTAVTLTGKPLEGDADFRWNQLRYLMIPRTLVRDADEPYVLGDFKIGDPIPPVPENLVQVYDSGNGMVLYKQKHPR